MSGTGYHEDRLRTLLRPLMPPGSVTVRGEVSSTNDLARRLAESGAPAPALVVADTQTAGRGRDGREWHSPPGAGIWMTLIVRPSLAPDALPLVPLAVGVGTAEALERALGDRVSLKWPNDLLIDDRKLGGVLVDSASRGGRLSWAVAGVGVNVLGHPREFPASIRDRATTLQAAGAANLDRETILAWIVASVLERIADLERGRAMVVTGAFRARDILSGRRVTIGTADGDRWTGVVEGYDPSGAILLSRPTGVQAIWSGTVLTIEP